MSFTLILSTNTSPANKIGKNRTPWGSVSGELRGECSIMSPVITVQAASMPSANYMYIPEFERYYFIKDIRSIRTGLWEITARVDVLESFAGQIQQQTVTLADTSQAGADAYFNNDVYQTKVKTKTDIIQFPSGLLDNGEFILITAGGTGTV